MRKNDRQFHLRPSGVRPWASPSQRRTPCWFSTIRRSPRPRVHPRFPGRHPDPRIGLGINRRQSGRPSCCSRSSGGTLDWVFLLLLLFLSSFFHPLQLSFPLVTHGFSMSETRCDPGKTCSTISLRPHDSFVLLFPSTKGSGNCCYVVFAE